MPYESRHSSRRNNSFRAGAVSLGSKNRLRSFCAGGKYGGALVCSTLSTKDYVNVRPSAASKQKTKKKGVITRENSSLYRQACCFSFTLERKTRSRNQMFGSVSERRHQSGDHTTCCSYSYSCCYSE